MRRSEANKGEGRSPSFYVFGCRATKIERLSRELLALLRGMQGSCTETVGIGNLPTASFAVLGPSPP